MRCRVISLVVVIAAVSACGEEPSELEIAGADGIETMDDAPQAAVSTAANVWHGTYYKDLWTAVAFTRDDVKIDFNWGNGSPGSSVPADKFAVAWVGDFDFNQSGDYVFSIYSDDGMCLTVDGATTSCLWTDHGPKQIDGTRYITAGRHRIAVNYYESTGGAVAKAWWTMKSQPNPLDGYTVRWRETFDSGVGALSHVWGPQVDTRVRGQLSMHGTSDDQDSGAMVRPAGRTAGFGYGLYSFTLKTSGKVGSYVCLWPGTDVWPGPELDVMELTENGTPYATIHWKGADGKDASKSYLFNGVDAKLTHTYAILWLAGEIRYFIDGKQFGDPIREHVPADAAHGGQNEAPGVGMQTWWNGGGVGSDITVYEVTYATR